jgi:hypothetical protein
VHCADCSARQLARPEICPHWVSHVTIASKMKSSKRSSSDGTFTGWHDYSLPTQLLPLLTSTLIHTFQ